MLLPDSGEPCLHSLMSSDLHMLALRGAQRQYCQSRGRSPGACRVCATACTRVLVMLETLIREVRDLTQSRPPLGRHSRSESRCPRCFRRRYLARKHEIQCTSLSATRNRVRVEKLQTKGTRHTQSRFRSQGMVYDYVRRLSTVRLHIQVVHRER